MATWEDVRRLVAALPGTDVHPSYGGRPSWRVGGRALVWDRPLRAADREHLGARAPAVDEPVLGVRVADEGVKRALLADEPDVLLTTPHFDGYPVVLVRLAHVGDDLLAELVEDAWRARAPRRLLAGLDGPAGDDPAPP